MERIGPYPAKHIPAEIASIIIALIEDDFAALCACAVASRLFLPFCRERIFKNVRFGWKDPLSNDASRFESLCDIFEKSPDVFQYTRRVVIYLTATPAVLETIYSHPLIPRIFGSFSNVKHVKISGGRSNTVDMKTLSTALLKALLDLLALPTLSTIHISWINNAPPALLTRSASFKHLNLTYVDLTSDDQWLSSQGIDLSASFGPAKLHSLSLAGNPSSSCWDHVLLPLRNPQNPLDLTGLRKLRTTITRGVSNSTIVSHVGQITRRASMALQEIEWSCHLSIPDTVDIGICPNLQSIRLTMTVFFSNPDIRRLEQFFSKASHLNSIESIALRFKFGRYFHSRSKVDTFIKGLDWKILDDCLSSPKVAKLKNLSFQLDARRSSKKSEDREPELEDKMHTLLSQASTRGILVIRVEVGK